MECRRRRRLWSARISLEVNAAGAGVCGRDERGRSRSFAAPDSRGGCPYRTRTGETPIASLDAGGQECPPHTVVSCHPNYVTWEHHYGENVLDTRKGAVRAREGDMGIIPGSMGARSYIVRGKGNPESFMSCSHGAGRAMSRTEAKRRFTLDDHAKATAGVECRKDADVIDETPMAYKSIDAVMEAQKDLVDVVHTLRQVVCVKG